jgi:hypothetical protein
MPITIFDDSERFRKATAGGLLAFRSHPNERGTERAEAESVLCLCACAVAAVVRARLRTALIEGHLAIVNPLFVARLAAEPLLGGAGRLEVARFAVGTRAGHKKSQRHPCNDKKPGAPMQIPGRTRSKTAAHGFLPYPVRARADVAAASAAAAATKCATARRGGFIMFVPGNAEQRAGFIRP